MIWVVPSMCLSRNAHCAIPFRLQLSLALILLLLPQAFSQEAGRARGEAWEQADRLFRSDPLWLGGDAAFSADLGGGRVLWMFGDSFVASKSGATRRQSAFIHNSIAIQTGYDPSQATISFYTPKRHGRTTELAPNKGSTWLWPLHGIRIGDRLLLFYMRMAPDHRKDSLGFQSVGWAAFLIANPDEDPSQWRLRTLEGPEMQGKMLVGMSLVRVSEYLDAFVLDDVAHHAYLLRWHANDAGEGRLNSPEWWCGADEGWQHNSACRAIVVRDAGTEFSVQPDPRGTGFVEVRSRGFGATDITMRHADHLEGPWGAEQTIYRPPESDAPKAFVYGAKSHPELTGAGMVVTYTANGDDARLATDMSIYFPRFVRIDFGAR
jgi:hypothetical protein